MRDSQVILGDGRTLAYTDIGRPDGRSLFFFHGAPMSRLHLVPLEAALAAHGLRVIAPDRPGYGKSSPRPGRSVGDWPADVEVLADALGIETFLVAGHSSGGAYAVASAALLPARVAAAVVVAGVTDMAWPPAWEGYLEGRFEIELMRLADEDVAIARAAERFGPDGGGFFEERFDLPAPDVALLADEAAEASLTGALVEAFRQGVTGYAQDVYLEGCGWPFDPGAISVPVHVVHGALDTLVPPAHSLHTRHVIPGATHRTLPGHGHLTILAELPAIASALARSVE